MQQWNTQNRTVDIYNLCKDESLRASAVQAEYKSDGLEKFLNADSKLFLLHSTSSSGVKDPRLNNKLEKIFQCLKKQEGNQENREQGV